jgi:transposase
LSTHDKSRDDRLRIASVLLAPRDSEGVVRAPLPVYDAKDKIKSMRAADRALLTAQVNWVQEYEREEGDLL